MAFARLPHGLEAHPVVLALAAELGPHGPAIALGVTMRLVLWADQHGPGHGQLPSKDPRALALAAGLGPGIDVLGLLRASGHLDAGDRLTLWDLTAGPSARVREDGRARAAASRALAPAESKPGVQPHFEAWWKDFTAPGPWGPYAPEFRGRGSKLAASKVWAKLGLEGDDAMRAELTANMHRQRGEIAQLARQGKFVPRWQDGERYLGKRRWQDEPLVRDIPPLPPEHEPPETNVDGFLEALPS